MGKADMAVESFDLPQAVTLFTQEASAITSLWTVYVAATFAAAGYGVSKDKLSPMLLAAITLGFLTFTYCHWWMVSEATKLNWMLGDAIRKVVSSLPEDHAFKHSLMTLTATANRASSASLAHALIDTCVVLALWSAPLRGRLSGIRQ